MCRHDVHQYDARVIREGIREGPTQQQVVTDSEQSKSPQPNAIRPAFDVILKHVTLEASRPYSVHSLAASVSCLGRKSNGSKGAA